MQALAESKLENIFSPKLRRIIEVVYYLFEPCTLSTSLDVCVSMLRNRRG